MLPDIPVTAIANTIHLAVAPVFLLTGIGAMLGVLSNRLGRIIDRSRVIHAQLPGSAAPQRNALNGELKLLSRRARMVNAAISLCTASALLIASVIAVIFLGAMAGFKVATTIALLFVAAMLAFIVALLIFLREVYLATSNLRIAP